MRKNKEYSFVLKFKEYLNKNKNIRIFVGKSNQSSHMDCEFIMNNEYIRLEAKVFSDSRCNSQNMLKIFGEILKGRSLGLALKVVNSLPVYYGLLFRKKDIKIIKNIVKKVSLNDWIKFGSAFDCKYVFIYDYSKKILYKFNWDNFYKRVCNKTFLVFKISLIIKIYTNALNMMY